MLHGEVKVNDVVIAKWTATRDDAVDTKGEMNKYNCTMLCRAQDGYLYEANFPVWHWVDDGPLVLTALVNDKAVRKLRKKPVDDETAT